MKVIILFIILLLNIKLTGTVIKGECLGDPEEYFILKTAGFSNLESKFKVLDTLFG